MEDLGGRGRGSRRSPRGLRPKLEAMETRALLSVTSGTDQGTNANPSAVMAAALSERPAPATISGLALNAATSQSPLIGTGPTRHELARQRFRAVFSGPVTVS